MTYYFGIIPSAQLNQALDTAHHLVTTNSPERWDKHRNEITHMISKELIDALLGKLVDAMPEGSERKEHLKKTTQTVEGAMDKLVTTILGSAKNEEVLPSFEFLDKKTLFLDNDGVRRLGFEMDSQLAQQMMASFDNVLQGNGEQETKNLSDLLSRFTKATLQHFLVDFTKTLNLGMIKRAAIPVADSVVVKAIDIMLHRLIPQMPQDGLERYVNQYKPLIIKKN